MRLYMLRRPNTLRKYQDAELTLHCPEPEIKMCFSENWSYFWSVPAVLVGWLVVPGGVQGQQVYPPLQHGLEPQGQRERHLGCTTNTTISSPNTHTERSVSASMADGS